MELIIPAIPAIVTLLLNFFAPYATALLVKPSWPASAKKWIAVLVALLLAAVVLVLAFFGFGLAVPAWPSLFLLAVLTSQTSYDLLLKNSADALAASAGIGSSGK